MLKHNYLPGLTSLAEKLSNLNLAYFRRVVSELLHNVVPSG